MLEKKDTTIRPFRLFFSFRLASNAFPDIGSVGRSVALKKNLEQKKSQEIGKGGPDISG